jgi:hypothetical protein
MWNRQNFVASTKKGSGGEIRCRHRDFDHVPEEDKNASYRPRIDPDERDEFDEWRRERGSRGRKPKAGGWHRYREQDEYWPGS